MYKEDSFFLYILDKYDRNYKDYIYKVKEYHKSSITALEVYVPHSKYYINISDALKNFCLFIVTFEISQEIKLAIFTNVFVSVIYPNINKIEDFEYCVLCTIMILSKTKGNLLKKIIHIKEKQEFRLGDIWEYMKCFSTKECNNHSELWSCPYSIDGICSISMDKVKQSLDSLINKKIIRFSSNGNYILRF